MFLGNLLVHFAYMAYDLYRTCRLRNMREKVLSEHREKNRATFDQWLADVKSGKIVYNNRDTKIKKMARQMMKDRIEKEQKENRIKARKEYLERVKDVETYGFAKQI